MSEWLVETASGPARATMTRPRSPRGVLVLGHGAGGASWSADVLAAHDAAVERGWAVVLVDQPWRVAGKRLGPSAPGRLDDAWASVVEDLARRRTAPGPLVVGGRSAGARVACRTAERLDASAVLALSFPLHPPGRPESSRAEELRAPVRAGRPVLVVQGDRDPFGGPTEVERAVAVGAASPQVGVVAVPGSHALTRSASAVGAAVGEWLARLS